MGMHHVRSKTPTGDIYYFNFQSGESIWDHPCDEFYRCGEHQGQHRHHNMLDGPRCPAAHQSPIRVQRATQA